ncbi:MAG: flavocytochrome c [Sutterellaceae bacterium]|nr:flavocytochrome c [Sutterellaceae bacterium]MDD7441203.1 flavocytochrome c [Sutterellaceae bacterium]MDY2868821.1 flavocytochrome c [Mesosutterella sp.]
MDMNRRSLLKGSAALGAAGLAAAAHAAPKAKSWDETVDVVVIGSGFAGLAAAIEAKQAGASVAVLEKMPTPGGNSIINGGILTATGCPQQKKHGIKDSFDLLANDMLVAGLHLNYPEKVKYLAQHALSNYEWCVNTLGVEFNPDAIGQEGGHSVPRYVFTKNGSGSGIVSKELEYLAKLGVKPRTRTYVQHIIRNPETGRVEGVEVRTGYRFPKAESGKVVRIRAKKGVVLCYGGFSRDVQFRMLQDPKLVATLDSTNQPGATSELWRETSRIGCLQVQDDWIQCTPWNNPKEKGMGLGWTFSQSGAAEYGLWVSTSGKRFVNELANRKIRADAIMNEQSKGLRAVAICTEPNMKAYRVARPGMIDKLLSSGVVKKYDSLEAIAADFKIPADTLKATVAKFNDEVKAKKDPEFGRYINNEQVPLTSGPWYAAEMSPKVHHCMGGLVTDTACRVMDVATTKPVPGLYAAGEATGGVHGAVRLGSCAILDCLVYGRIAGQSAAKAA